MAKIYINNSGYAEVGKGISNFTIKEFSVVKI